MKAIGYVIFDKTSSKYLMGKSLVGLWAWSKELHWAARYTERHNAAMVRDLIDSNENGRLVIWPICGMCGQPGECRPVIPIPVTTDNEETK